jgi:hypothetical protein
MLSAFELLHLLLRYCSVTETQNAAQCKNFAEFAAQNS